ncbi:MAG: acetylornithine/succinylornithine family transaminase [Archaeoglobus sp.]|nr:acetylornithine/succinylornithine family transaminase [Archaeoglobus sp.]
MEDVFKKEKELFIPFFSRLPVVFERGEGCWLYDINGKKYLDLVAGIACISIGHSHPAFVERVSEQLRKLVHVSNLYYTTPQLDLAEKLRDISGFSKFFFCNSGTEAVEGALKIARKVTGRKKFVALENSFHGRTMGALSVTWKEKFRKPFEPLISPVEFCRFNDVEDLERKVDKNTAAVIIEPIQGESGINEVNQEFMRAVFEKKDELGFLVIFDEVQTGFGRTGRWFAKEHFNIQPDIMTMAKAMGSGIPIGGIGVSEEVASRVELSEHGSTFGGNPLACTAAIATLEIIEREKLVENARIVGEYFKERLRKIGLNPRGKGLMLGFDLEDKNKGKAVEIVKEGLSKGLIMNYTSENTIRLVPPLTLKKEEVDFATKIIGSILDQSF